VASTGKKYTGIESDNKYTCPIIHTLKHYIWKVIAPEVRSGGTQNLELEVWSHSNTCT